MMQTLRSEIQGAVNGSLIIDGFRDSARTNGKARASKRAGSRGK